MRQSKYKAGELYKISTTALDKDYKMVFSTLVIEIECVTYNPMVEEFYYYVKVNGFPTKDIYSEVQMEDILCQRK